MNRKLLTTIAAAGAAIAVITPTPGCRNMKTEAPAIHHLAVVDPGHFHAALVTKSPLAALDDTIRLYAPRGAEADQYLAFIDSYNNADANRTFWTVDSVIGDDFMEAFARDSVSDIVVLAGKNRNKTDYIAAAVAAGKNVLSDKPMAIDRRGFDKLVKAYGDAEARGLTIYELMTERYDTINILTRELINDSPELGSLTGTEARPAVTMTSIHHFYKEVSGSPLRRPEWYYDTDEQGEGIADVTTHLIDLIMWQCFPGQAIDYKTDVRVIDAGHSTTVITPAQYLKSTGATIAEPIEVMCNGYILASIKGLPVRIDVKWDFEAPERASDSFCASYQFENGTIQVVQDLTTGYRKDIFVQRFDPESSTNDSADHYHVPSSMMTGHEEHFNLVTGTFLGILDGAEMPLWERPNTLAKYYITTEAVEMARHKD